MPRRVNPVTGETPTGEPDALRQEVRMEGAKDDIKSSYRKPFERTLRGEPAREGLTSHRKRVLHRQRAILTVKRTQRVRKPC